MVIPSRARPQEPIPCSRAYETSSSAHQQQSPVEEPPRKPEGHGRALDKQEGHREVLQCIAEPKMYTHVRQDFEYVPMNNAAGQLERRNVQKIKVRLFYSCIN